MMPMERRRLYDEARRAIEAHRWIESEKVGRDLGGGAERDWVHRHWRHFFRLRFVEHLRGRAFYEELGGDCFAVASERLSVEERLLDRVLEKIGQGAENLDVLCWAIREQQPTGPVLAILRAVDMNGRRLPPPIESRPLDPTHPRAASYQDER
jgi:hypothetical protein